MSWHLELKHAEGVFNGETVPGVKLYSRRFHVFIPYSESMQICDEITDLTEQFEQEQENAA